MVSGVVLNLVLHALKVGLTLPDRIHAQSRAHFRVTMQNVKKNLPSFGLLLRGLGVGNTSSKSTDFFSQEKHFPYLAAGQTVSLPLESWFEHRGVYPVDAFEIRTRSPFGFVDRGKRLEAHGRIVVYPALRELGPLLDRVPFLQQGWARMTRGGTQLHSIRHYREGDSARLVHWKSPAKTARLMIQDFMQESDQFCEVFFPTYLPDRSGTSLAQFEKIVSYLGSLAVYSRSGKGDFLPRLRFDSGEFQQTLDRSRGATERLLEYLARVQPSGQPLLKRIRTISPAVLLGAGRSIRIDGAAHVNYLRL